MLPKKKLLTIREKQVTQSQSQPQPIVQCRKGGVNRLTRKLTRPRAATTLVSR